MVQRPFRRSFVRILGNLCAGAGRGLRQPGHATARARRRAKEGNRRPAGSGGQPAGDLQTVSLRGHAAGFGRRRYRRCAGSLRQSIRGCACPGDVPSHVQRRSRSSCHTASDGTRCGRDRHALAGHRMAGTPIRPRRSEPGRTRHNGGRNPPSEVAIGRASRADAGPGVHRRTAGGVHS